MVVATVEEIVAVTRTGGARLTVDGKGLMMGTFIVLVPGMVKLVVVVVAEVVAILFPGVMTIIGFEEIL